MREILFRGKDIISGAWVQGLLMMKSDPVYEDEKLYYILRQERYEDGMLSSFATWYEVKPKTVGQYTGLKDINGKRIFEGDIIQLSRGGFRNRGVVIYSEDNARYGIIDARKELNFSFLHVPFVRDYRITVIGNIHDNPDLLEVQHE